MIQKLTTGIACLGIMGGVMLMAEPASATVSSRCVKPADWNDLLCSLPIAGTRCSVEQSARVQVQLTCAPQSCPPAIGGGCQGTLGSGYWFVVATSLGAERCQCGCVAEETKFQTNEGEKTARDLLNLRDAATLTQVGVSSTLGFGDDPDGLYGIHNLIAGPENKPVFAFLTETGRELVVTEQHPLVVVDTAGVEKMKRADAVEIGEYFVTRDGTHEEIVGLELQSYDGQTVNFDVDTPSHVVYPNNFKAGDNAWQQYLMMTEKRILEVGDIIEAIELQSN